MVNFRLFVYCPQTFLFLVFKLNLKDSCEDKMYSKEGNFCETFEHSSMILEKKQLFYLKTSSLFPVLQFEGKQKR